MRRARAERRSGYTLTEIAIVVAIMSALAGASWPMLMKPWQRSIIQRDAAMLREAMQNARLTAISSGNAYQLRWKLGKNEFEIQSRDRVVPEMPPAFEERGSDSQRSNLSRESQLSDRRHKFSPTIAATADTALPRLNHDVLLKERLSEGVVFDSELVVTDDPMGWKKTFEDRPLDSLNSFAESGSAGIGQESPNGLTSHHHHDRWSDPIVFHPNGRAENREITLHGDDGYSITLSLRGFTGTVTIGDPLKTIKQYVDEPQLFAKVNDHEAQRVIVD